MKSDSPFFEKLESPVVILEINRRVIEDPEDFEDLLKEGANRIYIWAAGAKRFVIVTL